MIVWKIPENMHICIHIYVLKESASRKCVRCRTMLELTDYIEEQKTCNVCLETATKHYALYREIMRQRNKDYRNNF